MNKDEILEKSRKENKKNDPFENDVSRNAGTFGMIIGIITAFVLWIIRLIATGETDYCNVLTIFTINAYAQAYTALRKQDKKTVFRAIFWGVLMVSFTYPAIMQALGKI